jgi:hypothetical protein
VNECNPLIRWRFEGAIDAKNGANVG